MESANVQLVRRGFEAVLAGDLAAVAELLDPEIKWHGGDPSSGCQNREQALGFMRQAASRPGTSRLVEVIDRGDRLVVVLEVPDRHGGDGMQLRANVTT
ncbi:MAG: nuclear transport factor 2 family protein, partial [Solirubrobacteraceae bacterium]